MISSGLSPNRNSLAAFSCIDRPLAIQLPDSSCDTVAIPRESAAPNAMTMMLLAARTSIRLYALCDRVTGCEEDCINLYWDNFQPMLIGVLSVLGI